MDVDHLDNNEFQIECLVRNLPGTPLEKYGELKKQLRAEAESSVLIPDRPHLAAYKNPKREIQICGEKLRLLQTWMKDNFEKNDHLEFSKIESRLLHIHGRLVRLAYSKAARGDDAYKVVLGGCQKLFSLIHKAVSENTSLETSIQDINGVSLDGVEDPDEDSLSDSSETNKTTLDHKVRFTDEVRGLEKLRLSQGQSSSVLEDIGSKENENSVAKTQAIPEKSATGQTGLVGSKSYSENELLHLLETIEHRTQGNRFSNLTAPKLVLPHASVDLSTSHIPIPNVPTSSSGFVPPQNINARLDFRYPPPPIPNISTSTSASQPFNAANPMWAHLEPCNSLDFAKGYPSDGAKSLRNWNIKFEGSAGDQNVEKFLFQVEFLASAYNVSALRLVKELSVLLRGEAYNWYWTYIQRHGIVPWAQLRAEFVSMYRDRRTDDDLRRDLEARKQKYEQNESFLSFYHDMLGKSLNFSSTYPDSELLRILKQNMRPGLQLALEGQVISDIKTLIHRCVSLEDKWKRLNFNPEWGCQSRRQIHELYSVDNSPSTNQTPVLTNHGGMMSSSTSYDGTDFSNVGANNTYTPYHPESNVPPEICAFAQRNPSKNPTGRSTFAQERENLAICWNCSDIGHYYQNCMEPIKHRFCFGCGLADTVKPNCPRCKASGNAMPRVRIAGRAPLQNPQIPNPSPQTSTQNQQNQPMERRPIP